MALLSERDFIALSAKDIRDEARKGRQLLKLEESSERSTQDPCCDALPEHQAIQQLYRLPALSVDPEVTHALRHPSFSRRRPALLLLVLICTM